MTRAIVPAVWHQATVTHTRLDNQKSRRSALLRFTSLSGAGKSTLAGPIGGKLHRCARGAFVLDGDNARHGVCSDQGSSVVDRAENIRRIGEMGKLFLEAGVITLTAFISPFRGARRRVRSFMPHGDFLEIDCHCPLEVREQDDVKGLYKHTCIGETKGFAGISSQYEEPENPKLVVDTDARPIGERVEQGFRFLSERSVIAAGPVTAPAPPSR